MYWNICYKDTDYEEHKQVEALFLARIMVFLVSSGTKELTMACCCPTDTLDTVCFGVNFIMCSKAVLKKQLPEGMGAFIFYENRVGPWPHSLELSLKEGLYAQGNGMAVPPP